MSDNTSGLTALLTPAEVAQLLRINVETLGVWRKQGSGPRFLRLGERKVRYRASDVESWLTASTEAAN